MSTGMCQILFQGFNMYYNTFIPIIVQQYYLLLPLQRMQKDKHPARCHTGSEMAMMIKYVPQVDVFLHLFQ